MDKLEPLEEPVRFGCEGETLIGVISHSPRPASTGVVIIVGGPQYRAGSHRQFVLLARHLAGAGWPTLRFDYRGMGDSTGAPRDFESIGDDIRAAIDALQRHVSGIKGVILWGLCDAATAALIYAPSDPRVVGLALANPWARAPQTYARTQLRHYYLQRAFSRQFWSKLVGGRFSFGRSLRDLAGNVGQVVRGAPNQPDFRQRLLDGLRRFAGPTLWLFSGRDLTAQEFLVFLGQAGELGRLALPHPATRIDIANADHTFADEDWQQAIDRATSDWLASQWPMIDLASGQGPNAAGK